MALIKKEDKVYASILADGAIHIECEESDPEAKRREFETSDGKTGVKFEKVYEEVSGIIKSIKFYEGDYGKLLQLEIVDGDEEPITLSLSTSSNFGEDVMKKLPGVDMEKPVRFIPFAFTDDKGKTKKGVTMIQDEIKLQNYFYDFHKKVNINGYPEVKKNKGDKPLSKDQWKAYFLEARIFLTDFITDFFKIEEVKAEAKKGEFGDFETAPEEEETEDFAPKKKGKK